MITITGTIDRINYTNPDSGWSVVVLYTEEGYRKATGIMPGIRLGMTVQLTGELTYDQYGETLKASECTEVQPSDTEGIEKYLASGLIKNIGPKLAKDIVRTFGANTLNILDNEPERLVEVYGIGKKRVKSIIASVKEQTQIRSIMIWLKRYDLTNGLAAKIYKTYGNEAIPILENNPYTLSDDIKGVGFHKADDVARRLGIEPTSPFRINSGINAVLEDNATEGSTYMETQQLIKTAASDYYLNLPEKTVTAELAKEDKRFVIEDGKVYLAYYYKAEVSIANDFKSLIKAKKETPASTPDINKLQQETGVNYSDQQQQAITTAVTCGASVITGGPGTGKTVTTNAIIRELESRGETVLLAAPTGRAAKRMKEVTGHEAMTIHRLLCYQQGEFTFNRANPLAGDALIVDEASMIDTLLMKHLMEAIPSTMRIVIVGDVDQLPSVGAGCVLRDIIDSGIIPTTRLTQIYRQAQNSDIIMNAHAVNEGRIPKTDNHPDTDFWFFQCEDKDRIASLIVDLVSNRVPNKFGYKAEDIQVLSPMKREFDPIGSTQLARRLQAVINPNGEAIAKKGETEFRVGDRIMQVKNDYDKGIFNGDIGTILSKENEQDEQKTLFLADFDGETIKMKKTDIQNIELAYACTVHKSQGSEYPVVIIPMHSSQYIMLKRNLLYTGVTRAKKQCILVGTRQAMAVAVNNEDTKKRYTTLKERLQQETTERTKFDFVNTENTKINGIRTDEVNFIPIQQIPTPGKSLLLPLH